MKTTIISILILFIACFGIGCSRFEHPNSDVEPIKTSFLNYDAYVGNSATNSKLLEFVVYAIGTRTNETIKNYYMNADYTLMGKSNSKTLVLSHAEEYYALEQGKLYNLLFHMPENTAGIETFNSLLMKKDDHENSFDIGEITFETVNNSDIGTELELKEALGLSGDFFDYYAIEVFNNTNKAIDITGIKVILQDNMLKPTIETANSFDDIMPNEHKNFETNMNISPNQSRAFKFDFTEQYKGNRAVMIYPLILCNVQGREFVLQVDNPACYIPFPDEETLVQKAR